MALAELMKEFGDRLQLGDVALEDDGGAQIVVDGEFKIDIERAADGPGFDITAAVCPTPKHNLTAIFAELLEANLSGQGTGGASLALDQTLSEIVLSRSLRQEDLSYDVFEEEVARFVHTLRFWRERFENDEVGAGEDPPADDPPSAASPGFLQV